MPLTALDVHRLALMRFVDPPLIPDLTSLARCYGVAQVRDDSRSKNGKRVEERRP